MNKPVYIGFSILELSETLMYEVWYHYIKPKKCKNGNLCYIDTDTFIVHVKTNGIYEDIAEDVETKFDASLRQTTA